MTALHHHPHDDTLMGFAAGTLNNAFSLVVSCHLQFCGRCRKRLHDMEDIGGILLETVSPAVDSGDAFFERSMKRFAQEVAALPAPLAPAAPQNLDPGDAIIMPRPLALATGLRRDTIPWTPASEGFRRCDVSAVSDRAAHLQLINIEAGGLLPSQRSDGQLVLILWGDYEFGGKRYQRGDLHDISGTCSAAFVAGKTEGVTFVSALSPVSQVDLLRPSH